MEKIPLQNALEQARANPNSQFATQLRQAIQSGKLDDAAQKQGVDLTKYGRPKVEQGYFQRVGEGIKQSFQEAGKDITTQDNRSPLSKGISAVSNVATAAAKPITEAPVIKQIGEGINKGINFTGEQLAKIYSPEFQASLANMSDEEFAVATQPLQDLANAGNIANTLLMAKGGQKGTSIAKDTVGKASEIAQKSKELIKDKTAIVGDVIKDITPTKETLRDRAVAKALRLSPVEDLAVIEQATGGNKIGEYLDKYELIGKNAPSTAENIAKFKKKNLNMVNDAISLVDDKFTFADIPELKTTVDFLIKDLSGRKSPEYQQILGRLNAMKNKDNFQLLDAQYVKNVFDDVESIYKRTGETRDALAAQDKAQTIAPVRRFIEERVKEKYPEIDIQSLNNNVRTTSAILDAIVKRAPKNTTASIFGLGDFATVGIGNQILPGAGFPALFGKKVIESAPIQLRFAKYLAGKTKDVTKGMSLEQIKQADQFIRSELESSIKDLDEVSIQKLRDAQKQIEKKLKNKNQTTKSSLKDLGETPSTNLINEAKKYKSAEEFVKAQTNAYHGSYTKVDKFEKGYFGDTTGNNEAEVFYFTKSPKHATEYSREAFARRFEGEYYDKFPEMSGDDLMKKLYEDAGANLQINPSFVDIKKPKVINWKGESLAGKWEDAYEMIRNAKSKGYDGVIFKNISDDVNPASLSPQDVVIAFEPEQILTKSQLEEIWKKANAGSKTTNSNVIPKSPHKSVSKSIDPLINEAKKYKSGNDFYERMGQKNLSSLREQGIRGEEQVTKFWEKATGKKSVKSYKMSHRPSESGSGFDLTDKGLMPKDFYTNPEQYIFGNKEASQESVRAIMKIKGKPNAEVIVYRASPKNKLNKGDWISLSKKYAEGESKTEGVKVYSFKVKAKDIQFAGDDINEFGYFPK